MRDELHGAERMAHQSRIHTALVEDPTLPNSTCVRQLTTALIPTSGSKCPFLASVGTQHMNMCKKNKCNYDKEASCLNL